MGIAIYVYLLHTLFKTCQLTFFGLIIIIIIVQKLLSCFHDFWKIDKVKPIFSKLYKMLP